jgi:ubiquinol-cytochrome c reductase cytochrome c1 subunit
MREMKILLVLIFFTGLTYWGVEPLAHSIMHPHVADADYSYSDVDGKYNGGDKNNGATLVQSNCIACHSIKSQGFEMPMSNNDSAASYGVVPPDLSNAGSIYNSDYLVAFVKNPAKASKVGHKFQDGRMHPMPNYDWMSEKEINDIVSYLKGIASGTLTDRQVFEEACGRCHSLKYDKIYALTPAEYIKPYMGSLPPDLSMMIRSRGKDYLHKFVNDPQKLLEGTAMPRVGLTQEAEAQVVKHMENIGDSKKAEREALGPKVLIYLVLLAVLAYLWKVKIWREVH